MRKAIGCAFILIAAIAFPACKSPVENISGQSGSDRVEVPFVWDNANIYFLMTDRFKNGNPENDVNFDRVLPTALLRGFEGGDLEGVCQKISDGYFDRLGVNALWFSPVVEQIWGIVDEGTGDTYGYHGYWTRDWTSMEPNFGTEEELVTLIETAHEHGIRVVMDVVLNHTGPVTMSDPVWPADWVRTGPKCDYKTYNGSVKCTLVENLPDILTESDEAVELPPQLLEKWEKEGRLELELAELEEFFTETGLPRAPRYYIMKWILDLIRDYGVDGFRIDTGRHVEESVWAELRKLAEKAFKEWKAENPEKILDDNGFYMMGEVYNYEISSTLEYDFGDRKVNYFENGMSSLINFEFKKDVNLSYEKLFSKYSKLLNGELSSYGVVNYISSHDDIYLPDRLRENPVEMGTKLLLCPGTVQIYYGDETCRLLDIPGTVGDATLRSNMNWDELELNRERNGYRSGDVLKHWQKLGRFRTEHPAVGAGVHTMLSSKPYLFTRYYMKNGFKDLVIIGIELPEGDISISVDGLFEDGTTLKEYYTGKNVEVKTGVVSLNSSNGIVLLGLSTDH